MLIKLAFYLLSAPFSVRFLLLSKQFVFFVYTPTDFNTSMYNSLLSPCPLLTLFLKVFVDYTQYRIDSSYNDNGITTSKVGIAVPKDSAAAYEDDIAAYKFDAAADKPGIAVPKVDAAVYKDDIAVTKVDIAAHKHGIAVYKDDIAAVKDGAEACKDDNAAPKNDVAVHKVGIEALLSPFFYPSMQIKNLNKGDLL